MQKVAAHGHLMIIIIVLYKNMKISYREEWRISYNIIAWYLLQRSEVYDIKIAAFNKRIPDDHGQHK